MLSCNLVSYHFYVCHYMLDDAAHELLELFVQAMGL